MESANIHQQQLQDQLVGSSSSLATPSCYGVGSTTHAWTPNPILNTNGFHSYPNETILNPREQGQQENVQLSSYYSSMAPDLGFHWVNTTGSLTSNQSAQDLQLSRIKEELSDHYYLKYTEPLSSSPSSSTDELSLRNEQRNLQSDDIGTKLLFTSSYSSSNGATNNGRDLSQIFPSINVSNLNQEGLTNPGSLDMNLQAIDLLTSSRFSGNFSPYSQNQIGLMRDGYSYSRDYMQQSYLIPLYSSNKISTNSSNGAAEAKRASSKMEPKALQTAPKKSRLEARASCQPFKVRKEKLGDRIAALQQLVAPFGKTDTASVLMEAIGYIKFLQNQVETLSVPYMKTSRNKSSRAMKAGPTENESEESKRDLKSRGLCLVPLSCMSYITDGGGAVVWPPPHFGGAT
ncbi:hypothetical protein Pfo_017008 [Paulownia fortunei]|nr:hypothetical protein Pfo_017008 [Paulownia fortunei]